MIKCDALHSSFYLKVRERDGKKKLPNCGNPARYKLNNKYYCATHAGMMCLEACCVGLAPDVSKLNEG
jgi:hypothetical protein